MEETYLCFESDAALFLIPLGLVYHIVPGKARAGLAAADGDPEIPVMAASLLWGKEEAGEGNYIVLLQKDGSLQGLSVSDVLGVYLSDPRNEKEIPLEARGEQNVCLKKAVYLDKPGRWAFILDERIVLQIKGL